ncbi:MULTISPECIES: hypothetical protein [Mumia]|uniref:hypothetical protein n=1 Tax=Mumia TaxID=1546255 RepID=UPI0014230392|nr:MULTISPECIES: hypothetical protein [unclassified Mumia]QMW64870.1 hypothetical protein H4N58_11510 [Mumia sp. ZJ1417]
MPSTPALRVAAIAAPVLLFLYGVLRLIDGADGDHGPGLAWDVGHLLFLASFAFFGVLVVALRGEVTRLGGSRVVANAAATAGLLGVACFAWVIVGDLLPSFKDAAPLPDPLQAAGPLLFPLGLITLVAMAVRPLRGVSIVSPLLTLGGFLLLGFDLDLLSVGAALVLAGLTPLAIRSRR